MIKSFCLSLFLYLSIITSAQIVGTWKGSVAVGPNKLPLVFHFSEEDGKYGATMDSPAQGANGIPCSDLIIKDNEISLKIPSIGASYSGKLELNVINGMFDQNGFKLPLNLKRDSQEPNAKMARKQDPIPPFPYEIKDFSFKNEKDNVVLSGTLTLPDNCPNCPVVIMQSGSGPQNRNSEIMDHRPFWVIADALSKSKIAVLRFDDRGVGKSTGNFSTATTEDFTNDFLAGIKALKASGFIDSNQIGILGHSEGALVCLQAAKKDPKLAFAILLAGPTQPGGQILLKQQKDAVQKMSLEAKQEKAMLSMLDEQMNILLKEKSLQDRKEKLNQLYKKNFKMLPAAVKNLGIEKFSQTQIAVLCNPWMDYYIKYNPLYDIQSLNIPTLALFGEKDTQVPAVKNEVILKDNFNMGDSTLLESQIVPELNHLFQPAETGDVMEYHLIDETFDLKTLNYISAWINKIIYQ